METAFLAKSDWVKSDICALVVTNNELQITTVKWVDHMLHSSTYKSTQNAAGENIQSI